MLELTRETYYSPEADREYFSCSQFDDFCKCEAAAVAKYEGRYQPEQTEALLVGNYFHTYMESPEAHEQFKQENADALFTRQGKLKAGFRQADELIQAATSDPFLSEWINRPGENEKIITGKLFDKYPWKIRLDKYFPHDKSPVIVDWKTVADIHRTDYNPETRERESFVRSYGYLMRAAVYLEIEKQAAGRDSYAQFFLACVSKQSPPDKAIIALTGSSRQELDYELEKIKEKIWHFQQIKDGVHAPKRCGVCPYCRATNQLSAAKILHYTDLDSWHERELEADYEI